jgi:hypothetical protein
MASAVASCALPGVGMASVGAPSGCIV